jgi:hypothetical protein
MIQAMRNDRRKSDRVPAKISSPGYGRQQNLYISNIRNMALQIIPREHNFDFHHRTGGIWWPRVKYQGRLGTSKSCRSGNVSFEELSIWWGNLEYWESELSEEKRE